MLKVYHAEPGANSLKVLLALKEKGVDFESHYVALNRFEQHEDWFKQDNPNGQVPVIVHDGRVINESTVINEYLDASFDGPALRPADEYGRAMMRIWTKFVDEYFCPALSYLAWNWIALGELFPQYRSQLAYFIRTADSGYPQDVLAWPGQALLHGLGLDVIPFAKKIVRHLLASTRCRHRPSVLFPCNRNCYPRACQTFCIRLAAPSRVPPLHRRLIWLQFL